MPAGRGTRVIAKVDIGTGPFSPVVKAGTRGIITEAGGPFSYPKVAFEGHKKEVAVSYDKLQIL